MKTKMKKKQLIKGILLGVFLMGSPPLLQAQKTPAEIYCETSPSVVLLISGHPQSSRRFKGTGSIIGRGLILTSAHVVLDEKEREWVFVTKSARPHNQGKICHG